jgi:hypothetical protein
VATAAAGGAAVSPGASQWQDCLAIVPDNTRPFTLTIHNAADGREYVVAHYEPNALSWNSSQKAALLCEVREAAHTARGLVAQGQ